MTSKHPDVKVKLTGTDGNTFALLGRVSTALNKAGYADDAREMTNRVFECGSYNEALATLMDYVEVS